jgi:uncharacterized protein YjbI with pentapeptide repeats
MLWVWPLFVIGVMALLGHYLGSFGVLLGGVGTIGVLLLFVGAEFVSQRILLVICAVACAVLTAVYFGYLNGLPDASGSPASHKVATARGTKYTLTDLRDGGARGAELTGAVLDNLDLSGAQLDGITAPGVPMKNAILDRAQLAGADLHGVDLRGAHLHAADMRGANLSGANLFGADLTNTCLSGANLTGAILDGADFEGATVPDTAVSPEARAIAKNWPTSIQPCD